MIKFQGRMKWIFDDSSSSIFLTDSFFLDFESFFKLKANLNKS